MKLFGMEVVVLNLLLVTGTAFGEDFQPIPPKNTAINGEYNVEYDPPVGEIKFQPGENGIPSQFIEPEPTSQNPIQETL